MTELMELEEYNYKIVILNLYNIIKDVKGNMNFRKKV